MIKANAQRQLDNDAIEAWPTLNSNEFGLSNDGNFAFFITDNLPKGQTTLTFTCIASKLQKSFVNAHGAVFNSDNQHGYFMIGADSLAVIDLHDFSCNYIENVQSFRLISFSNKKWLCYLKSNTKEFRILDLASKKQIAITNVSSFNSKGSTLILEQKDDSKSDLFWFNLLTYEKKMIYSGSPISDLTLSNDYTKCSFLVSDTIGHRSLYLYTKGLESAFRIDLQKGVLPGPEVIFNKLGTKLFFTVERPFVSPIKKNMVSVDIWSYKDDVLQPEQLNNRLIIGRKREFSAVYDIAKNMFEIIDKDEDVSAAITNNTGNFVLVTKLPNPRSFTQKKLYSYLDIVDLDNLSSRRRIIKEGERSVLYNLISPDEKYVIWFDLKSLSWHSFEISTGKSFNISAAIPSTIYDETGIAANRFAPWGLCGWMTDQNSVLLYDQYDIWKVSLDGTKLPFCITNNFGRKNQITMKVITDDPERCDFSSNTSLILSGYSFKNKDGGYWDLKLGTVPHFSLSHLQPYSVSTRMPVGNYGHPEGKIIACGKGKSFLILRESAEKSPNLYLSNDLKKYVKISNIQPENKYSWLTANLLSWKMLNGDPAQGILYKPKNFNPKKRYPVIFNYYEKRSDEFHKFLKPGYSQGDINIPSFVMNGYLVFVPDVYSIGGHNGLGTYNSIESAAILIGKLPFVDSTKLGLQGHSYGGWQTNYMITHSKRFVAACEAAGVSDQVSGYGLLYGPGMSRDQFYEIYSQGSAFGIGVTPWNHSSLYIENSPIFKIDSVTTPLLMMHNSNDQAVPFEQGIEMFTALRRANKKVWMLQYDNGYHTLPLLGEAKDYQMRMLQFFDYYLKGKPAPVWMTTGIPAYLKGSEDGLELDKSGIQP